MINKLLPQIKDKLKKRKFIYALNASLKTRHLKKSITKQNKSYADACKAKHIQYDEAVEKIKFKHSLSKKGFKPKVRMTVLWIGTDENQDRSGFLQSLNRFFNVIEFIGPHAKYGQEFPPSDYNEETRRRNGERLLLFYKEKSQDVEIDFILGQMLTNFLPKEALLKLSHLPVINITMDDRLPHLWETRNGMLLGAAGYGEAVDLTLTTCSDMCNRYNYLNMPSLFWPLASDPAIYGPQTPRDIDISFVGNKYGIREKIVTYLQNRGLKVDAYGAGWPNGRIDHNKAPEIFGRSKIILGIGTVAYTEDIYTLKLRDFDALMSGAMYITHRNQDLVKIFSEGKEIEFYSSLDELYTKIVDLLKHPKRMQQIGSSGREKVLKYHTWDIRFQELRELLISSKNI